MTAFRPHCKVGRVPSPPPPFHPGGFFASVFARLRPPPCGLLRARENPGEGQRVGEGHKGPGTGHKRAGNTQGEHAGSARDTPRGKSGETRGEHGEFYPVGNFPQFWRDVGGVSGSARKGEREGTERRGTEGERGEDRGEEGQRERREETGGGWMGRFWASLTPSPL